MPIERTPQNSPLQDFIEQNQRAQSPFLTEADDQPIEITIGPEDGEEVFDLESTEIEAPSFDANLAEFMDDSELQSIADELLDDFDNDNMSRKDWEETYKAGLDLLGIKIEDRSEPWDGACGVFHPMLTEAAIDRKSTRLNSSHIPLSRMPSSA